MLLVNFKSYEQSSGNRALSLAKACERISRQMGVQVGVVPNFIDLKHIRSSVRIPVFAQGLSSHGPGAHTGSVVYTQLPRKVGVVLNHSESRLEYGVLKSTMALAKKNKIATVVCARDAAEAAKVSGLKPDYIAVEPPELIGGKVSVSQAKPEIIRKSVNAVSGAKILVGAGIHSGEDVRKALELGAVGVFVASAVCKAKSQSKILKELSGGFKNEAD